MAMLSTWGIEFARRAFFVVAPIAKPTKTSPIHSTAEVRMTKAMPAGWARPDRIRKMRETTTEGRATTRPLTESPSAYDAGETLEATNMSWKRNHCLLKYTLCEAKRPVKENVRTIAPISDCRAAAWSAKTKMKITGRNEKRLITTSNIGSRRSGKASNNPMYIASRIFDFNRSPHDLDARVLEARRFERHLALLPQAPLDDRQDLLARLGLEDLRSGGPIPRGRFHDHPHPDAGIAFRLVDGSEEGGPPFVDD